MKNIWLLMVLAISACNQQDEKVNLVHSYIQNFEEISVTSTGVYLVLPSNSCANCVRAISELMSQDDYELDLVIITDIKSTDVKREVILDDKRGRIAQYNPYINSPYVFCLSNGVISHLVEISTKSVGGLDKTLQRLLKQCK